MKLHLPLAHVFLDAMCYKFPPKRVSKSPLQDGGLVVEYILVFFVSSDFPLPLHLYLPKNAFLKAISLSLLPSFTALTSASSLKV